MKSAGLLPHSLIQMPCETAGKPGRSFPRFPLKCSSQILFMGNTRTQFGSQKRRNHYFLAVTVSRCTSNRREANGGLQESSRDGCPVIWACPHFMFSVSSSSDLLFQSFPWLCDYFLVLNPFLFNTYWFYIFLMKSWMITPKLLRSVIVSTNAIWNWLKKYLADCVIGRPHRCSLFLFPHYCPWLCYP